MSWRSVLALLILAFAGGALAFSWLNADTSGFWEEPKAPIAAAIEEAETAAPSSAALLPAVVQPSASQAESLLLVLQARRAIEAGRSLGELSPRLQSTFGQARPQAVAAVVSAKSQQVSNTALLERFDALAPQLVQPAGTAWDRARHELANLFVIRRGEAQPTILSARIAKARQAILVGDIERAASAVRMLPAAEYAKDWLAQADRAIAVRRALDSLDQAAILPAPTASIAEPVAETSVAPIDAPLSEVQSQD